MRGGGEYKEFVVNSVKKMQADPKISWRHEPTKENPVDLGSRGG